MRQPLEVLLAAVPDHALRDLILALVKNGTMAVTNEPAKAGSEASAGPVAPPLPATAPPAKRKPGRPRGRKPGPTEAELAERRARAATAARDKRARLRAEGAGKSNSAAARQGRASSGKLSGDGVAGNGNGSAAPGRPGQRPTPSLPKLKFMEGDGA
jgi:hypothetical protein